MDTFVPKTFRAIFADMKAWIIATQDKITDFNEGAALTSFIEAVANEVEQVYLRAKIGFIKYLPDLPFYAFNFTRHAGVKSSGNVVFSRNVVTTSPVTIPIGTLVSTPSGLIYVTTAEGTILASQADSGSVPVEAQEIGGVYNVVANSITLIATPVVGVDSVNNASATSGGLNAESDEDFVSRFQAFILGLGRGNIYGLITAALSVTGIRSASVVEHFPPVSGYNVSVYVDDGAGNAPPALLAAVLSVIVGDGTAANPGYKPAGINVEVVAPTKVTIDVTLNIVDDGSVDRDSITVNVTNALNAYINGLKLGEDVIYYQLVESIMNVVGVYDIALSAPTANISIGPTQVARVGTITITYS